jgi:hypothetical protein
MSGLLSTAGRAYMSSYVWAWWSGVIEATQRCTSLSTVQTLLPVRTCEDLLYQVLNLDRIQRLARSGTMMDASACPPECTTWTREEQHVYK